MESKASLQKSWLRIESVKGTQKKQRTGCGSKHLGMAYKPTERGIHHTYVGLFPSLPNYIRLIFQVILIVSNDIFHLSVSTVAGSRPKRAFHMTTPLGVDRQYFLSRRNNQQSFASHNICTATLYSIQYIYLEVYTPEYVYK